MILDKDGNPILTPEKHRFGFFRVPEDAHIKGFGSITAGSGPISSARAISQSLSLRPVVPDLPPE